MTNAKITLISFLLAGFMLQGCSLFRSGPATGPVSAVYTNQTLTENYDGNVFKTSDAAVSALKDFNMTITNSQKDASGGNIDARRSDGTTVNIALRALGKDTTLADIKVGALGNEELARAIGRRIEAHVQG
ncbi:MAG TPA: DUF3568 family protein [Dissulfurispiraceae bacterium]